MRTQRAWVGLSLGITGATANVPDDCHFDAGWHIPIGSPCVDTGAPAEAPLTDRDGEARPNSFFDIGPDEVW